MPPSFARLETLGYIVEGLTALLALRLTILRRYHLPFACLAGYVIASDVLRAALRLGYPYAGLGPIGRVLMVLDPLLFVWEPLVMALAAVALWAPRWREASWGILAIPTVALALLFPRGFPDRVLWWVEAAAQGLAWGAFAFHLRLFRRWGGKPPTLALVLFAAGRAAVFAGPYLDPRPLAEAWPTTWGISVGTQLALIALHLSWLAGGLSPVSASSSEDGGSPSMSSGRSSPTSSAR